MTCSWLGPLLTIPEEDLRELVVAVSLKDKQPVARCRDDLKNYGISYIILGPDEAYQILGNHHRYWMNLNL